MRSFVAFLLSLLILAPASHAAELDEAVRTVERIRGLSFERPVQTRLIARSELRPILERELDEGLPLPFADYVAVLAALHLLQQPETARGNLLDLYDAQVLAFYDPRSDLYYQIDSPPAGLPAIPMLEDSIVVHELMHALQDQRFGAGETLETLQNDWDAQLAYHALLEGEATLVMFASLYEKLGQSLDALVQEPALMSALETAATVAMASGSTAEPYFMEALKFPYLEGLRFVVQAYREGGWEAVNALHRDPPRSTARLLDGHDESDDVVCASAGDHSYSTRFGPFHWRFLLGAETAAGWTGDCVTVRRSARGATVLVSTRWATEEQATAFADTLGAHLDARGEDSVMHLDGRSVRFGYGADRQAILEFLDGPRL